MRAYLPFLTSEALCMPPTRMSFQPSVPVNSVDPHADFVRLFPLDSFLPNTVHNVRWYRAYKRILVFLNMHITHAYP